MKPTRSNVYYNLEASEHLERVDYNNNTIIYVFSSEYYRKSFAERRLSNREKINKSLSNRFSINISVNLLADLVLYSKIEKRGFYLLVNGVKVECLESIILDGLQMMKTS